MTKTKPLTPFKPIVGTANMVQVPPMDHLMKLYIATNPKAKKKLKGTKQYFETKKKKGKGSS